MRQKFALGKRQQILQLHLAQRTNWGRLCTIFKKTPNIVFFCSPKSNKKGSSESKKWVPGHRLWATSYQGLKKPQRNRFGGQKDERKRSKYLRPKQVHCCFQLEEKHEIIKIVSNQKRAALKLAAAKLCGCELQGKKVTKTRQCNGGWILV